MISGDNRQVVDQCRCGDLLVQGIFWMRYAKTPPKLGNIMIDIKDIILIFGQQVLQPLLQLMRLACITTVANRLNATPQFTDRDDRYEQWGTIIGSFLEKGTNPRIGF